MPFYDFLHLFSFYKIEVICLDPLTKILHPEWGTLGEDRYRLLKVKVLAEVKRAIAAGILKQRGKLISLSSYEPPSD